MLLSKLMRKLARKTKLWNFTVQTQHSTQHTTHNKVECAFNGDVCVQDVHDFTFNVPPIHMRYTSGSSIHACQIDANPIRTVQMRPYANSQGTTVEHLVPCIFLHFENGIHSLCIPFIPLSLVQHSNALAVQLNYIYATNFITTVFK